MGQLVLAVFQYHAVGGGAVIEVSPLSMLEPCSAFAPFFFATASRELPQ